MMPDAELFDAAARGMLATPESIEKQARRMIEDAVWNERNFMSVFSAGHGFLNSDLAMLYGLPSPATEFPAAERKLSGIVGA
jgi:hypothetical protein